MSQTVSLFYSTVLLIVYTSVVSFACCLYLFQKQNIMVPIIGMFALFLLDSLVILMTENSPRFAAWYDGTFPSTPSIKSVIFIGVGFCALCIWNMLSGHNFSLIQYLILIVLGLWLFFVPLMKQGSLKVWLYFLGYQVFSIATSAYGLKKLKEQRDGALPRKGFRAMLVCVIVLSLMILTEDTFVIFHVDSYSVDYIYIFSRSFSEDILRMILTFFFFYLFAMPALQNTEASLREKQAILPEEPEEHVLPVESEMNDVEESEVHAVPEEPEEKKNTMQDYKRIKFAQHFCLTDREVEILALLLDGMSNQEISQVLHISLGTVKAHIHNIFQKIEITHRQELLLKFETFTMDLPS